MAIWDVWANQPGEWFCVCTKSASGQWREKFFKRSEIRQVRSFVNDNLDKDVYACPHGFSKPKRLKEYAVKPKLLWADLDSVDPRKLRGAFKPTMAWESSPNRFVGLWVTEETMNEELNQRLSYHLGADRGGWDFTQVLRLFPGTTNYKYANTPKVRLLWADGDSVSIEDLDHKLPAAPRMKVEIKATANAQALRTRYKTKFPHWLRRDLEPGDAPVGARSEQLWKIGAELIERGIDINDAFVLIQDCKWNKFRGRRSEEKQLLAGLEKILADMPATPEPNGHGDEQYQFLARSMDEVEEENIDWIWYPYLARGELSILEGDPGLGKSYLAQMVAVAFVDGKELPSVKKLKPTKGKVAYFDIENSPGTVTKKRLTGNGCVNLKDYFQEDHPFSIDDEDALDRINGAIERLKPTLVVFDTINTYLGKANTGNASETTQAFANFKLMASRFNCSVLVLRHLTKGSRERALYRGQGSIAFAGLARSVMTVGIDPEDPEQRVMAVTKLNIGKIPQALTFSIEALPDTLKETDRSQFVWGDWTDLTADDILAPAPKDKSNDEKDACEDFLRQELEGGPQLRSKLLAMAEARNLNEKMIKKIVKTLCTEEGAGANVKWALAK